MKEDSHRPDEFRHQEWLVFGLLCFIAGVFNFALVLLFHRWWSVANLTCGCLAIMMSRAAIQRYQQDRED